MKEHTIEANLPSIGVDVIFRGERVHKVTLSLRRDFRIRFSSPSPHVHALMHWVQDYSQGKSPLVPTPIFEEIESPFQKNLTQQLARIPFGQTLSYSDLAKKMDREKAARAVGTGCGKNPFPFFLPCHRVVAKNESLGGFAFPLEIKRRLLNFELRRVSFNQLIKIL